MNQKIFDAAQNFEEIYWEMSHEINILQAVNEGEDLTETYAAYYRDSRKKLLEVLKKFFLEESRNDFVTLFGVYCNFYLKRSFQQILPEEDFGVSELWAVIADENFQKYLSLIQQGIDKQQENFFEDALKIFDEYSLPHLYLFVFAAQKYDLAADDNSSEEQKQFLESAQAHYNKMDSTLREYSLGIGKFIFRNVNPSDDRNLLPFVKAVDVYSELVLYAVEAGALDPLGMGFSPNYFVKYLQILTGKQRSDFANLIEESSGAICPPLQRLNILLEKIFRDENVKLSKIAPAAWRDAQPPFNIAYLKIPLKISNAGRFLLDQMEKLRLQRERDKIWASKNKLVKEFTHRYKNLQANRLGEIAESLLQMEDEQEKLWGRALLLELARKETLTKEAAMLNLRYNDKVAELTSLLKNSLADGDGTGIADVLQTAFLYCFIEVFYDYDRKYSDAQKMRDGLERLWNDIDDKKISFEREVIFNKKICIEWLKENGFALQIDIDNRWKKISLQRNNYADVFLRAIFVEMFKNFLKHGEVEKPVELKFHSDEKSLRVSMRNFISAAKKLKGATRYGLSSMDETLKTLYVGEALPVPAKCVRYSQDEKFFFTELEMPAEIFLTGADD